MYDGRYLNKYLSILKQTRKGSDKMISKELLSEVLDIKLQVTDSDNPLIDNGFCYYKYADNVTMSFKSNGINIYELAHKCKKWACSKEYKDVGSWRRYDSDNDLFYWMVVIQIDSRIVPIANKTFTADTEPEAIFKACEWILNDRR